MPCLSGNKLKPEGRSTSSQSPSAFAAKGGPKKTLPRRRSDWGEVEARFPPASRSSDPEFPIMNNSDLADFTIAHCKPRLLANINPRKMKLFFWGQDICMYLRYPAILNRPRAHVSTWPDTCPNGNRRGLQVRIGFGSLHKNFEVCALQFQPEQSQSLSWK